MILSSTGRVLATTALLPALAWSQGRPESAATVFREDFTTGAQRDDARSTADWGSSFAGALLPGPGGGLAVHGDLRVESGVRVIDVSRFFFPPTQTLTGTPVGPIGGAYYFQSIYVAPGATLILTGTHGARLYAAEIDIQGTLDVSGESAPLHASRNDPCPLSINFPWISNDTGRGGDGGRGGPGGSDGGSGGDDPRPIGPAPGGMPANLLGGTRLAPEHVDGENGAGAGGGKGSQNFPGTLITSDPIARLANVEIRAIINYCIERAGGAGGGSFGALGFPGREEQPFSGPAGPAGGLPQVDPALPPGIARGGFGGGGGGVHPYFTNQIVNRLANCKPTYPAGSRPTINGIETIEAWNTGCGGGGGGGYLFLQCTQLQLDGVIAANGGNGGAAVAFGQSLGGTESGAGGGGGSGGGVRLDLLGSFQLGAGAGIEVLGGAGGRASLNIGGGNGGHGLVHARLPALTSPQGLQVATMPSRAFSSQPLQGDEGHPFSFATSRWYASGAVGRPVLDAFVTLAVPRGRPAAGIDPTDPTQVVHVGVPGGLLPYLGPCYLSYQSATDDGTGAPVTGSESSWTFDPSSLDANDDLVRFTILVDSSWFGANAPLAGIVEVELLAL